MGLDTTHDCWHGPYSSFKRFRDEVAVAAAEHYGYVPVYEGPSRVYYGWWDDDHPYSHILDVFFLHSDCGGWIFPRDAGSLADALDPLIGYLADEPNMHRIHSSREKLRAFVAGLRSAAEEWQIVGFH